MNELFIWLITLISFLIGYALGSKTTPKDVIAEAKQVIRDIKMRSVKPGLVKRPDAKTVYENTHLVS